VTAASIREAVILAAGKGSRMAGGDEDATPKPLVAVAGVPLVKRAILTMARAGIERVHVVIGFKGDEIRAALERDPAYAAAGVEVRFIDNPDYERANGVSVLKARGHVGGPFLLSMADHVFGDALARKAAGADLERADLVLCVDRRIRDVYDIDDATKVKTRDGAIVEIAKELPEYDAIDCGVFAVTPALFDALERARSATGDCSLSDGVRQLARAGRARVLDVGEDFWHDVDTPEARRLAERGLLNSLRKRVDGPVARHINRHVSLAVTRLLVDTEVTPNQMTVVANLVGAAGIWCVLQRTWPALALGALLVQLQSILDGCDGELARLKFQSSRMGEWLDNVLDDHVNLGYGLALGLATAALSGQRIYAWLGIAAAAGWTVYNAVVYAQLALVHHTGNPFAFRWWYQRGPGDLTAMLERPGLGNRISATLRALGRRDVYLFGFLVLTVARLPGIAVVWFAILGIAHAGLALAHLVAGGWQRARAPQV
jgi:CDP-L-myo-inositol myo-inositolphosphotransferase